MTGNFPVLIALLHNVCGRTIFHKPLPAGSSKLVSTLIFLLAVYQVLKTIDLHPPKLRRLWKSGTLIVEFFMSSFIMECLLHDFWFPFEDSLFALLPAIAIYEKNALADNGIKSKGILSFLENEVVITSSSYVSSLFFLVVSLHATRAIDLRLLKCGFRVFWKDIACKIRNKIDSFVLMFYVRKRRNSRSPTSSCTCNDLKDDHEDLIDELNTEEDDEVDEEEDEDDECDE